MRRAGVAVLVLATVLVIGRADPSGATTLTAADEAEYRAALSTLSGDTTGPHTLTLTADIVLDDAGDPVYDGTQPLTVDGDGHSITVTADETRALWAEPGSGAITLVDLEVSGGNVIGGGGGVSADVLSIQRSTFSGNSAGTGGAVSATNLNVLASTITGNSATTSGGGISGGVVTLDWSTVIDNSAPVAANLAATSLSGTASVLAGPQGGGENCTVVSDDVEGFMVSDDSCGGTVLATEPVFEALADNGGPTRTRHPAPGNPVIRGYQCSEPFVLFPPPPPELTDQRGEPRALINRLVNFEEAAWICDVGALEVQLTEVTVTPDPATVVAGPDASWTATLTVDGPYPLDRFGPLPDGCTVDGTLPVPVGESIAITCDLSDRLPGSEVERLAVSIGSPYDPNHPLLPQFPLGGGVMLTSGVRVICGANARTDVGPWLDPAMTWFDCDARFAEAPPATRFYPSRFLSRIAFARMLIDATPSLIPQNPNAPLADVPQKQRWIVRRVTSDPDGDGPRPAPMTGFANDEFHPSTPVSRAEVVRALWRWVGQPTGFSHDFTDVPPWVDEAVAWAAANDVVTGFPGPTFRPYETATKGMALQSLFRADTWFDAP